jgi:hypothetical protein
MVHSQTTPASPSAIWSARSPFIAIFESSRNVSFRQACVLAEKELTSACIMST